MIGRPCRIRAEVLGECCTPTVLDRKDQASSSLMTHASPGDRPPTAFLSHASEDKGEVAEPLGRELARLGVRPWLDQWEIRPGDSLVQKLFDEGLAKVDAVVVLVSRASVDKPWVREELDSAMVGRITRGTRLIPVRLDGVEMPEPLKHLVWINADRSQAGIQKTAQDIADTVHGHDPRPAVGPRPGYTALSLSVPGLTKVDAFLLTQVIRHALGDWITKFFDFEPIKTAAKDQGVSDEMLFESLYALSERHYLNIRFGQDDEVFVRVQLESVGVSWSTGIGWCDRVSGCPGPSRSVRRMRSSRGWSRRRRRGSPSLRPNWRS